jgi:TRAP-type C4-dicarboxylate transport system permease small subunit
MAGRVYDGIVNGLAAFAGAIVAAMVVLIVVDVAMRNLGLEPPAATVALTEYALLYFTMAAAPWLTRRKGNVTVLILLDRLAPGVRARAAAGVALFCAAIAFVLSALSTVLLIESLALGDVEPRSIDLPRWLLFLPMTVGLFFTATEFVRFVVRGEDVTVAQPEKI